MGTHIKFVLLLSFEEYQELLVGLLWVLFLGLTLLCHGCWGLINGTIAGKLECHDQYPGSCPTLCPILFSPAPFLMPVVTHFQFHNSEDIPDTTHTLLQFSYLLFPTHFPCILFACSYLMLIISFYRLSFPSCAALLFMHSLMHSMITHAQSCTVCLLMHSLLRHSLVTQYIRTG